MRSLKFFSIILVLVALFLGEQSLFIVKQTQQAIILRLGDPKRVIRTPGLKWKFPFIENVVFYDNRVLSLDPPEFEVLLTDKKRINIDAYARYKIVDPLLFYKRVRNVLDFGYIFNKTLNAAIRRVIAKISLPDLLLKKRVVAMKRIASEVSKQAQEMGVNIVDVRIGRANLPEATAKAVYSRMRTEREREAKEARAQGAEMAQKIRAAADKQHTIILSIAEKKAEILRGTGEAQKNAILAAAYKKDLDFFTFYKSIKNYSKAFLGTGQSTFILNPSDSFFKYLKKDK